ncbi:hypothetical protein BH23GEM6_BH23GEM6_12830 [soil metagenome]
MAFRAGQDPQPERSGRQSPLPYLNPASALHILLTDVLTCPRCGPDFGLILMADEMQGRAVAEGRLGCLNCREGYRISNGVADLLLADSTAVTSTGADHFATHEDTDVAYRFAALLGASDLASTIFLGGLPHEVSAGVAKLLPDTQVAATAGAVDMSGAGSGQNWIRHGIRLPFRSQSMRGVALSGEAADRLLDEAVRILKHSGRLVLDPAPTRAVARLRKMGLELLLEQDGVVVASIQRGR